MLSPVRRARAGGRAPLPPGFGAIWSSVAIDLVGFGIVLPLLPLYAERFGASATQVGLLVASFSIAQFALAPVWGRVSDRVGRKPVLVLSLVGTAIGSLLTGLAGSLAVLFLGRVVDGASGASVSVAQAAVADVATPAERARLFGLLGAAFGLGFVGGPALGAVAALGGRRLPFLLAAAIAGANAVWALRRLPETHAGHARSAGATQTAAQPQERSQPESSLGQPEEAGRGHDGASQGPGLGRLAAVAFVSLVSFSAFEATFALFGERRLGFHLASTGAVFAAIGVVIVVVQVGLVRPAVRRLGEEGTLRAGLALTGVGLLTLAGVRSRVALVVPLLLVTVGQGLVTPSLSSTVAGRADRARRGAALGIQQSAGGLARVVGPSVGGALFQHAGVSSPYLAGAALLGLAVVLASARPLAPRR